MLNFVITVCATGVVGYLVYGFAARYRAATGTVWERMIAAERGSATILLQKAAIASSGLTVVIDKGLDLAAALLNDPAFAAKGEAVVQSYLTPTTTAVGIAVFSAVTIWARLRTAK